MSASGSALWATPGRSQIKFGQSAVTVPMVCGDFMTLQLRSRMASGSAYVRDLIISLAISASLSFSTSP
jgi:hypothetical protein